jgi:hypothetical protein
MPPESRWQVIKFQASLQCHKSHENWSWGHPKSWKMDPEIMRNPISVKVDFCHTSHTNACFYNPWHANLYPPNHLKKHPKIEIWCNLLF